MTVTAPTLAVRHLAGPSDDVAVHDVFRATLALGRPLAEPPPGLDRYAELCLGWYLGPGRAGARVLADDHDVVGYALVCTDEAAQDRWARRRVLVEARRLGRGALASPFWRNRLRDLVELRRAPHPAPAHAHLNLRAEARTGLGALALCMAIDDVCRDAGLGAWYGEINARAGRRAVALERVLGEVVHRAPNHTLTWALGRPVERLTVLRRLVSG